VKVLGNRVELEDIEAHLRKVCGSEAAAVAWPVSHGSAVGVVGFVTGTSVSPSAIREALKARLPTYMVPSRIHPIAGLPRTAVGKLDRKALVEMLELAPADPKIG
jgi:acyl-CoA synthetase (AMP-forming)/AMP-acid ligase II